MNTTQRIMANGGHWRGSHSFCRTLHANNPWCGHHWQACITNNPGGNAPQLNPTEWDEMVSNFASMALVA